MKKKGITLIETIVSMMLLTIMLTILVSLMTTYSENIKTRILRERLSRISYCVVKELKYNYSIEELYAKLKYGEIRLRNYDILSNLKYKELLELENGNDIIISIIDKNDKYLKLKVLIRDCSYDNDYYEERELIKWR